MMLFNIGRAADEILMCCCEEEESKRDRLPSAWRLLICYWQVPEAVEELCETTPPAGQQPQGQADWQAEADAEGGGLKGSNSAFLFPHYFASFPTSHLIFNIVHRPFLLVAVVTLMWCNMYSVSIFWKVISCYRDRYDVETPAHSAEIKRSIAINTKTKLSPLLLFLLCTLIQMLFIWELAAGCQSYCLEVTRKLFH